MKCKKYSYILVLMLMIIVGINKTYAEESKTCYYISSDDNLKISLRIRYGYEKFNFQNTMNVQNWAEATIWKTSENSTALSSQHIENWFSAAKPKGSSESLQRIYKDREEANTDPNPKCPRYIIYTSCSALIGTSDKMYATDSGTLAMNAINSASSKCEYSKFADNYKDGKQITDDVFFSEFEGNGLIEYDSSKGEYTCADVDMIFGDKNDPESLRYMINQVLIYVRIIVPILIILLGTLDFAKAVFAGKEDNMKKAQSTFIRRLIAGVAIFFIPILVDIIMELADYVWAGEYIHCDF